MPDYRDPKYTSPDDEVFHMTFPQYPDPSVSKKPVNVTITTANTTGDYPLTADHIQERVEFLSVIQALVDVIDAHGWQGEDHIAYEQAQGLLARK